VNRDQVCCLRQICSSSGGNSNSGRQPGEPQGLFTRLFTKPAPLSCTRIRAADTIHDADADCKRGMIDLFS